LTPSINFQRPAKYSLIAFGLFKPTPAACTSAYGVRKAICFAQYQLVRRRHRSNLWHSLNHSIERQLKRKKNPQLAITMLQALRPPSMTVADSSRFAGLRRWNGAFSDPFFLSHGFSKLSLF
jgi:hypothetical protein